MTRRLRIVAVAMLALVLGAFPVFAQKGPSNVDGVWRFERIANGRPYVGTVSIRGGVGLNVVRYAIGNVRTIVEFPVRAEFVPSGVIFRPTGPSRYIEQGRSEGYNPDIFDCRWSGEALTCTNVDQAGVADDRSFILRR